jgi:type II secretory pathway component PulK
VQRAPSTQDTLYSSGVKIDQGKTPQDIFSRIEVGENSYADVEWKAVGFGGNGKPRFIYGLQDEQGKININECDLGVLSALLQLKGLSKLQADTLAQAVIDFRSGAGNFQAGNQNWLESGQEMQTLKPKRQRYEHLLELLEVKGMTRNIFDKIKDDLTVFGDPGFQINVLTSNNDVIWAVANSIFLNDPSSAAAMMAKAYALRDAADSLNPLADSSIAGWPALQGNSRYYRAHVTGVDEISGMRSVIEAVIYSAPGGAQNKILAWHRD